MTESVRLIKTLLKRSHEHRRRRRWPWIVLGCFLVIIGIATTVYLVSTAPLREAKTDAFEVAQKEKNIVSVSDFYYYNGIKDKYSVIVGPNNKKQETAVFVPRGVKGKYANKTISYLMKDGITKEKAIEIVEKEKSPSKILTTHLGMDEGTPIWEISYRKADGTLNYLEINFITSSWYRQINNL